KGTTSSLQHQRGYSRHSWSGSARAEECKRIVVIAWRKKGGGNYPVDTRDLRFQSYFRVCQTSSGLIEIDVRQSRRCVVLDLSFVGRGRFPVKVVRRHRNGRRRSRMPVNNRDVQWSRLKIGAENGT